MINRECIYIGIYVFSVFISSVSQILLKKSANMEYESRLKEYLNWRVILAYTIFFGSAFITTLAFRYVTVGMGNILESLGYFFVVILSAIFLNEKISRKKVLGMLLVIIGVIIFNISI